MIVSSDPATHTVYAAPITAEMGKPLTEARAGPCRTLLVEVDQVAGLIADLQVAAVTLTGSTGVGALGAEGIREFPNVKTVWIGPAAPAGWVPAPTTRSNAPMCTDPTTDEPCFAGFPPAVLRPAELTAFSRGGGARTIPLVTRAVGAEVFLTGQTLFEGGAGIPLHTHNCPESVTVLEGDAIAEIDGTEHRVTRFDTTYVAAGTPHRFRNASATEPLRILWIYASVDATRTLVETGATARVDAEHTKTQDERPRHS